MSDPASHSHTPDLAGFDSQGRLLRHIAYERNDPQQPAQRRITLDRYGASGQLHQQWDPRLFEQLEQAAQTAANQRELVSLSGIALLSESSDAGWRLTLHGEAGQPGESWDSRASHWQTEHDELLRPLLVRETAAGQATRVSECFSYARDGGGNCRGRLVRHDDDAGSRLIQGYSLTGQEQHEIRHFLASLDLPDWPDAALESGDGAHTRWRHGPLAQVLEQADARGNRQSSHFTLSGELASLALQMADGSAHALLRQARYDAFGQVQRQVFGNDVVRDYRYDPATGRLCHMRSSRPGRSALQDLTYGHDPVGNVIRIEDRSQPVSHFANQRVEPVNTFAYDSLYRLTQASGREAAGAIVGPGLPELMPSPGDTSRLLNYTQHYTYDASDNLLSLRHVGYQHYTRTLEVATNSNRAVATPDDPQQAFDDNGNLLRLAPGQPLHWNARNQLHGCRQVARETGADDEEHYRYGGAGLRLRKVVTRQVAGRLRHSETRYLPGLELHERAGESFSVVTVEMGRCLIRCLHWSEGPPATANPQLRYSLDDLHDSSGLELDGNARIISHEGWYPFGGTAWWAAGSAVEAGYKTRRYCAKERDGSGLYAYGLRYYAAWLARWINADPAGDVDGPNRYRFARNNPVTLGDSHGLDPEDRFYTLMNFSNGPKAPQSANMWPASATGNGALQADGRVADFVYNTLWSTRSYLDRGAANQVGSVLGSSGQSAAIGVKMRMQLPPGADIVTTAEHALAARTGMCDEFAKVAVALMSSSTDWPGTPLFVADNSSHVYGLVNDYRVSDPLVVDAWVTFPAVHHLSQSLNAEGMRTPVDYSPRMPGDPRYAISRSSVEFLRETLYWQSFEMTEQESAVLISVFIRNSSLWSQLSAMKEPHHPTYQVNGIEHDAASVPLSHWDSAMQSLRISHGMESHSTLGHLLRRF